MRFTGRMARWARAHPVVCGVVGVSGTAFTGCMLQIFPWPLWLVKMYKASKLAKPPRKRITPVFETGNTDELRGLMKRNSSVMHYLRFVRRFVLAIVNLMPLVWYGVLVYLGMCSMDAFALIVQRTFTRMGCAYVKLGQWIATRPDIFPRDLCDRLQKLFNRNEQHSFDATMAVLTRYGIADRFASIEADAIASGSVAQVHRATLAEPIEGVSDVAIKVIHPGVRDQIYADITVLRTIAGWVELIPSLEFTGALSAANEFSSLLLTQMDMRREGENLQQFRENFEGIDRVQFPRPLMDLSFSDVLVESFEKGDNMMGTRMSRDIADTVFGLFMKMIFQDNYIHADLHPGNMLLRHLPNGRHEVVVLDPGLVTSLSPRQRRDFIGLFAAVACGDGELGARLILEDAPSHRCGDPEGFYRDMKKNFDVVGPLTSQYGFSLKYIDVGGVLAQVLDTMRQHRVCLEGRFATLISSVMVLEGTARQMYGEYNIMEESMPYLAQSLEGHELQYLTDMLRDKYSTIDKKVVIGATSALLQTSEKIRAFESKVQGMVP